MQFINDKFSGTTALSLHDDCDEPFVSGILFFMEQEIWKDIIGLEGFYQISNHGRLRSLVKFVHGRYGKRKAEKILKFSFDKVTGYYSYTFKSGVEKPKRYAIHRLVAIHFICNPLNLPEVNHEDGNKLNNCHSNLEWVTRPQNIQHAFRTGLIKIKKGEDTSTSILTDDLVRKIFSSTDGPRKIARDLRLPYSTVNAVRNGCSWNHITGLPKKVWNKK